MKCEYCPHCRAAAEVEVAPEDTREFWYDQRRGLMGIVTAIEKRFRIGRYEPKTKSMAPWSEARKELEEQV